MTNKYQTIELTGEALEAYIKARFPKNQAEELEEDEAEEAEEDEPSEVEYLEEHEARLRYDSMLDDCYPPVNVCGYEYDPSRALKELDPIAYECGFNDYCSSLEDDNIKVNY